MQHTIIELEDGLLTMTVVTGGKQGLAVPTCMRMPLGDLQGGTLVQTLRSLRGEMPEEAGHVHLLLGDRRCQHFTMAVPQLPASDLEALVVREALRIGGLPAGTAILLRARYLARLPNHRKLLGVTAIAKTAWQQLAHAFDDAHIQIDSLASIEDGLAITIGKDLPPRTAVLEYSAGRARFALCEHGAPVQVRRFLVTGAEQGHDLDTAVMVAQLAMEVPRTLDFLREQGQAKPDALLVSRRVGLPSEDLGMFAGEVDRVVLSQPVWQVADGQDQPGLATYGYARALLAQAQPSSLLLGVTVQIPAPRWRQAAAAALLTTGLIGVGLPMQEQGRLTDLQQKQQELQFEGERLQHDLADLQAPAAPAGETEPQRRFRQALATRRPHSLLLAAVCNAAPTGCSIERIEFSRDEDVLIDGVATGASRQRAAAVLGSFVDDLHQIGCITDRGQENVAEADAPNRLRFRFHLHWRRS